MIAVSASAAASHCAAADARAAPRRRPRRCLSGARRRSGSGMRLARRSNQQSRCSRRGKRPPAPKRRRVSPTDRVIRSMSAASGADQGRTSTRSRCTCHLAAQRARSPSASPRQPSAPRPALPDRPATCRVRSARYSAIASESQTTVAVVQAGHAPVGENARFAESGRPAGTADRHLLETARRRASPRASREATTTSSSCCRAECMAVGGTPPLSARASSGVGTVLPGFMMLRGSSARLIVRIRSTASPCSATSKSILRTPMPCSPVQVPSMPSARGTTRSCERLGLGELVRRCRGRTASSRWKLPSPTWPTIGATSPSRREVGARSRRCTRRAARSARRRRSPNACLPGAQRQRGVVGVVPRLPQLGALLRLASPSGSRCRHARRRAPAPCRACSATPALGAVEFEEQRRRTAIVELRIAVERVASARRRAARCARPGCRLDRRDHRVDRRRRVVGNGQTAAEIASGMP